MRITRGPFVDSDVDRVKAAPQRLPGSRHRKPTPEVTRYDNCVHRYGLQGEPLNRSRSGFGTTAVEPWIRGRIHGEEKSRARCVLADRGDRFARSDPR